MCSHWNPPSPFDTRYLDCGNSIYSILPYSRNLTSNKIDSTFSRVCALSGVAPAEQWRIWKQQQLCRWRRDRGHRALLYERLHDGQQWLRRNAANAAAPTSVPAHISRPCRPPFNCPKWQFAHVTAALNVSLSSDSPQDARPSASNASPARNDQQLAVFNRSSERSAHAATVSTTRPQSSVSTT